MGWTPSTGLTETKTHARNPKVVCRKEEKQKRDFRTTSTPHRPAEEEKMAFRREQVLLWSQGKKKKKKKKQKNKHPNHQKSRT